jgi:hypothetical protein
MIDMVLTAAVIIIATSSTVSYHDVFILILRQQRQIGIESCDGVTKALVNPDLSMK